MKIFSNNWLTLRRHSLAFAVICLSGIFLANSANAVAYSAAATGNWNVPGTWTPSGIPVAGDTITMPNANRTVTVPAGYAATCDSITFTGGNRSTSIVLGANTASLTIGAVSGSGNVTINLPTVNGVTKSINVGAGSFSAKSLTLMGAGVATRTTSLLISTGTATISGNITSAGVGSQIVFSGAGTLNAGGTFLSGTQGTFTASTGTVNFNAAGAQTISPFAYTFNNVILSGTGVKTTTNATINGILSMEETATASAAPSYGVNASLRYNTATARLAGPEWLNTFTASGGLVIANTGLITLNASKVLNTNVNLTINNGAHLSTNIYNLSVGGNFSNAGTFSANASTVTVSGNWANTGTFNAGTSTVVLNGVAVSAISGNNTFNNFTCATANKSITVAQGSTQTIGGLFRIDGNAFGTRVSLASSGGVGTTWDLILNGTHDCRMVAVQGSNASSATAFLPINPAGYKNNGNNTNWYDSSLPLEMIFYDNFETSTLNSTPPNKPSSHWAMGPGWHTQNATAVNTQNHTPGGTLSMYSSGGNAGQGIGCWNSPNWGPAINCSAEGWFYDDMQNPKRQWLFIDNAAGTQGIGVMIDSTRSTTKYVYCIYIGGDVRTVSFIDRTLGWHKVTWTYNTGGLVELFLDGILLTSTTGLSDFADYDTGSWSWDNINGCTPMWFDDFMVYRSQHQSAYRWFNDDNAENPTALAAENTGITRDVGTLTRLRIQVQNDQTEAWGNDYVTIQYREGTNGVWQTLNASAAWNYANGLGTDTAQVATALLTGSNIRQHFVESIPSMPNLSQTNAQYGEWDFSIIPTTNAVIGASYYFRLVLTNASGVFTRELASYAQTPQCIVSSPTIKQWNGSVDNNWDNPNNWAPVGVPTNTHDVIVQTTATRDCRVNIATAQCKSILIQSGRTLLLDTATTALTVSENISVYGTITQSNATANLSLTSGTIRIDGTGRYNHSSGALNAATVIIQVINGGQYNISGSQTITAQTLNISVGGLVNVTGTATLNLQDFSIVLNGQWLSSNIGNTVNLTGNVINDGSMLGSTGGVFNLTNASGTTTGTSSTTTFYQLNINGGITNSINDVKVLNNFSIAPTKSFTASSGNLYVGGNWINSGTFSHGSGTIVLDGTALQTITAGGANFNRLTITNTSPAGTNFTDAFTAAYLVNTSANSLMTFAAGQRYDITAAGGMNLSGAAGQLIRIRSSAPGTYWTINPSGLIWTCNYLDVQDSVNICTQTILPTNSFDSGHNINWFVADSDTDQLPDQWEFVYYGDLDETASSDTDTDGLNNILEYEYTTDPTSNISPTKIYVDDDSAYTLMDGSEAKPYRYLEDAIALAPADSMLVLKEGSYRLSNYTLAKNLIISGSAVNKTIINGPYPSASSSNSGQFLHASSAKFAITNLSLENFREDQPIISYNVANTDGFVYVENVKFTDNNTGTKSLIAPSGIQSTTVVYLLNNLFYNNSNSAYIVELKGAPLYSYHNTITANTSGGILLSGTGNSNIYNCIIRENSGTEINNSSTGTVTVSNSNIEGGFPGSINSYDSVETYIDSVNGIYRLRSGTAAINAGIQTLLYADFDKNPRPDGVSVDVGAFEYLANDSDGDGLTNANETIQGTNPDNPDSDSDGLSDYEEVNTYLTLPNLADTDGDEVKDGDESAIGMDPTLSDGVLLVDLYDEKFEDPSRYPPDQTIANSIWGASATYSGDIFTESGDSYESDGNTCINFRGHNPSSRVIMFIQRNFLPEHWIAISYKTLREKLPTNINQALVISGAHFAVNEAGYLCAYDPIKRDWIIYGGVQILDNAWFRVMVHRNHAGKYCNVYLDMTNDNVENGVLAFSNLAIYGPDLDNYIRISFSSRVEFDLKIDTMHGMPYAPF